MNDTANNSSPAEQRQRLSALCRFLSARFCYRFMLLLLSFTGLCMSLNNQPQFAPYGIALVCLLLPAFLTGSAPENKKKENNELPLSVLYRRYHYSPSLFQTYRITALLCMFLLLVWHKVQSVPVTLYGLSVALLYLALYLALYPVLGRILYLVFHRRLMRGGI